MKFDIHEPTVEFKIDRIIDRDLAADMPAFVEVAEASLDALSDDCPERYCLLDVDVVLDPSLTPVISLSCEYSGNECLLTCAPTKETVQKFMGELSLRLEL